MKNPRVRSQKSTKCPTPKKRPLLTPPPVLPDDVRELYASSNFVELGYRNIEKLRENSKRTPDQDQRIADHDAIEHRIAEDPHDVMREAHKAIDHGTELLLKLIRSRKLEQRTYCTDGTIDDERDEAFSCLESRLDYLNRQLVRFADAGVPRARASIFYQAKTLAEAFVRLAQAHPGDFISSAESALTMPSIRSRNMKYTADAEAIAKAIHLAEKHPAGMMTEDNARIGEFCGYLVAKILDSIAWERKKFQWDVETLEKLKRFSESADKYRDVTIEEYIRSELYPQNAEQLLISSRLPEFSDDPKAWWKMRILPTIRENFSLLKNNPSFNAALWTELCRLTDNGTDGAKLKALSDNCRNKVNQFARRAGAKKFV